MKVLEKQIEGHQVILTLNLTNNVKIEGLL